MMDILLVDDEPLALENVYEMVPWEQHGFRVVAKTTSSMKALELFLKHRPKIVITDISMPHMDGLTLGRKIQEAEPGTRLLFLTAYRDFDYVRQALEMKAANYVLKHEISRNRLLGELLRIKEELQSERARLSRSKRSIISDVVLGKEQVSDIEAMEALHPYLEELGGSLAMLYMKTPPVYTLGGETLSEPPPLDEDQLKAIENAHAEQRMELQWLSAFTVDGEGVIFLLKLPLHQSYLYCWNEVQAFSRWLQNQLQAFKQEAARPNLYVVLQTERNALHSSFRRLSQMAMSGVFQMPGAVVAAQGQSNDHLPSAQQRTEGAAFGLLQSALRPVLQALAEGEAEEAARQLDKLWNEQLDKNQDEKALRHVLRELGRELSERYQVETGYALGRSSVQVKAELLKLILVSVAARQAYSRWVLKAMEYVRKHYSNSELSLELLSQHLQISSAHLRAVFKKETGQTLSDYMTEYRVEKAKELLQQGQYKIYEVSEMVGYKSSQYFSQVFKKATSKHPKDYM
ncbi:response regulator [Paenibacillus sp. KS-LC4]|uniref:response regulator transcription factor n=1 Tax=Paenibacillus sp. KS-LC4 TaxID=2979727 RepID=UPI0030D11800